MKYLIRANKVVFSGNMQMIMKYISDFYKSEPKLWTDKNGNFTDLGKFKTFIDQWTIKFWIKFRQVVDVKELQFQYLILKRFLEENIFQ